MLIQENKWRAARYGLDGSLIEWGKKTEVPMRELTVELLAFDDDVVDGLGSRRQVTGILDILRDGTRADRQLQVYRDTNDRKAVVAHLVRETKSE